jgi:hypothetical protein
MRGDKKNRDLFFFQKERESNIFTNIVRVQKKAKTSERRRQRRRRRRRRERREREKTKKQ